MRAHREITPLPPHVTFDQAKAMLKAILRGDPDAPGLIRQSFRGKIEEFLHRR